MRHSKMGKEGVNFLELGCKNNTILWNFFFIVKYREEI
jgi:hypothetical protein